MAIGHAVMAPPASPSPRAHTFSSAGRSDRGNGPIDAVVSVKAGGCLRVFDLKGLSGKTEVFQLSYGGVDAPGTTGIMSRMALARQVCMHASSRHRSISHAPHHLHARRGSRITPGGQQGARHAHRRGLRGHRRL